MSVNGGEGIQQRPPTLEMSHVVDEPANTPVKEQKKPFSLKNNDSLSLNFIYIYILMTKHCTRTAFDFEK